jgi:hypothetical protein
MRTEINRKLKAREQMGVSSGGDLLEDKNTCARTNCCCRKLTSVVGGTSLVQARVEKVFSWAMAVNLWSGKMAMAAVDAARSREQRGEGWVAGGQRGEGQTGR